MSADTPSPVHDSPPSEEDLEAELEDLATLDVDATAVEVMTAVHWIETHTAGLGSDPFPAAASSSASPPRRRRRPARALELVTPLIG